MRFLRFIGRRMYPAYVFCVLWVAECALHTFSAFSDSQNVPCMRFLRLWCFLSVFLRCPHTWRKEHQERKLETEETAGGQASERAGDGGSVPARSNSMCRIPSLTHRWIQKASNPCTSSCCGNTDRSSRNNNYICVRSRPRAATRQDLPHSERAGWWICMHRYTLQWNYDIRHLWGDVIPALCYAWIEIVVNFVFTVTASPSAFATPLFSPDFAVSR